MTQNFLEKSHDIVPLLIVHICISVDLRIHAPLLTVFWSIQQPLHESIPPPPGLKAGCDGSEYFKYISKDEWKKCIRQ